MAANHGSAEFWGSSEETKARVYEAFAGSGAELAVASCPPNIPEGWQPIAGTNYCLVHLHEAMRR